MVVIHFLNEKDFPKNVENINGNLGKRTKLYQKRKSIFEKRNQQVFQKTKLVDVTFITKKVTTHPNALKGKKCKENDQSS